MDYKEWLLQEFGTELSVDPANVNADEPFENMHIDSLSMVSISYNLETAFNLENIDPAIFSEYNTINKLTEWLNRNK